MLWRRNNAGVHCVGSLTKVPFSVIQNTFDNNVFGDQWVFCPFSAILLLIYFHMVFLVLIWSNLRELGCMLNSRLILYFIGHIYTQVPWEWFGLLFPIWQLGNRERFSTLVVLVPWPLDFGQALTMLLKLLFMLSQIN